MLWQCFLEMNLTSLESLFFPPFEIAAHLEGACICGVTSRAKSPGCAMNLSAWTCAGLRRGNLSSTAGFYTRMTQCSTNSNLCYCGPRLSLGHWPPSPSPFGNATCGLNRNENLRYDSSHQWRRVKSPTMKVTWGIYACRRELFTECTRRWLDMLNILSVCLAGLSTCVA